MKHIVLLGDSIFDNKPYVNGGRDVITHLREQMPEGWEATLCAVDGNVASHVPAQTHRVPEGATHLFVSVGGNDALGNLHILNMNESSSAQVLNELSNVAASFERSYINMLSAVLRLNNPTTVCTIYYPRFPDPAMQKLAVAALSTFNDVIIKQAFLARIPLIDLRILCNDDADYANPIEPSEAGGLKISKAIIGVANEHDFDGKRTSVYF